MSERKSFTAVIAIIIAIGGLAFGYYNYLQNQQTVHTLALIKPPASIDGNCYWDATFGSTHFCSTIAATDSDGDGVKDCRYPYLPSPACPK